MKLVRYTKKNAYSAKFPPSYPNEMMVKILSSKNYSNINPKFFKKKNKILEVGCFSGNNLRFFIENGFDTYGVEINSQLINLARQNLKRLGIKPPTIKLGNNLKLPFKNSYFDTLVSINTIHYSSGIEISNSLTEFKRVLKKGGVLYLETAGKNHFARKGANKIGYFSYKSNLKDFRKHHAFGYFDNKQHLKKFLKNSFNKVDVFERYEFTKLDLHFYVAICY